jgi:hypothetical protein
LAILEIMLEKQKKTSIFWVEKIAAGNILNWHHFILVFKPDWLYENETEPILIVKPFLSPMTASTYLQNNGSKKRNGCMSSPKLLGIIAQDWKILNVKGLITWLPLYRIKNCLSLVAIVNRCLHSFICFMITTVCLSFRQ